MTLLPYDLGASSELPSAKFDKFTLHPPTKLT
jgi:hypothetical protein